jgi:hypothetical protein
MMEAMMSGEKSEQSCTFVERRIRDRRDQEDSGAWKIVCDIWNIYANRSRNGSGRNTIISLFFAVSLYCTNQLFL